MSNAKRSSIPRLALLDLICNALGAFLFLFCIVAVRRSSPVMVPTAGGLYLQATALDTRARLGFWLVRPDGKRFFERDLIQAAADSSEVGAGATTMTYGVLGAGDDRLFGHAFLVEVTNPPAGCWELGLYYRDHSGADVPGLPDLGLSLSTPVEVRAWFRGPATPERFSSALLPKAADQAVGDLARGVVHLSAPTDQCAQRLVIAVGGASCAGERCTEREDG